jgi:large subunit ribosomal protein L3
VKEILGKKLGMTKVFGQDGQAISVTVVEAGPCPVIAKRTNEIHGYTAYQVGFGTKKKTRITKPYAGQFKQSGQQPSQFVREISFEGKDLEVGGQITVSEAFKSGDRVDVSGISRGLGFAGTMKRHNFSGANKTHGQSDRWRAPGSLGQSSFPSRVFKGMRMATRMGRDRVTALNLEVVDILPNENLILIKGAVPGFKGSLVRIRTTNRGHKG